MLPDNDVQFRPIVIPKATMDRLLKLTRPSDTIAVYLFYYYTAVWQQTNTVRCTACYVARALSLSVHRVYAVNKRLKSIGLIKQIVKKGKHKSQIEAHYINVLFAQKRHTYDLPQCGESTDKCFSTNSNKCFSNSLLQVAADGVQKTPGFFDTDSLPKNTFGYRCAEHLKKTLLQHRKIMRNPKLSKWCAAFTRLERSTDYTKKDIQRALSWYRKHINDKFTPKCYSGTSFCNNFERVRAAMQRSAQAEQQEDNTNYDDLSKLGPDGKPTIDKDGWAL